MVSKQRKYQGIQGDKNTVPDIPIVQTVMQIASAIGNIHQN